MVLDSVGAHLKVVTYDMVLECARTASSVRRSALEAMRAHSNTIHPVYETKHTFRCKLKRELRIVLLFTGDIRIPQSHDFKRVCTFLCTPVQTAHDARSCVHLFKQCTRCYCQLCSFRRKNVYPKLISYVYFVR